MTKLFSLLSKISYTIVIFSFFLPFVVIQCQQTEIMTSTGVQLAMGESTDKISKDLLKNKFSNQAETKQTENNKESKKGEPNLFIIGIAILAILGLAISFLVFDQKKNTLMIISGIGLLLLFIFGIKLDSIGEMAASKEQKEIVKMLSFKLQIGYYLAIVGFLITFIEPLIQLFKNENYGDLNEIEE